jgi:hypothetical protein
MTSQPVPENLAAAVDSMLDSIEGGELHRREKVSDQNALPLNNFLEIGQTLKACAQHPDLISPLLDKLSPHIDVIIGVLPPGLQSHGLIPDAEGVKDLESLISRLEAIDTNDLRQWVIDDCSLIYGELTKAELKQYFEEVSRLLTDTKQFIDLGSGLGKVVMTAALKMPFSSCVGVELVPYRHSLATERFVEFCREGENQLGDLKGISTNISEEGTERGAEVAGDLLDRMEKIAQRVEFRQGDMLACDISEASLIFIYSTCFGSIMHKIADKIANDAPEGCLVSATTYSFNHPGLKLIKHFPPKTIAWTDVRFYQRVGVGPWPEQSAPLARSVDVADWKKRAIELLIPK